MELFDIQYEDRRPPDLDFDREGCVSSDVVGSGRRDDLGAAFAFFADHLDAMFDLFVFGTDDQGRIPRTQETAGRGQTCDDEIRFV